MEKPVFPNTNPCGRLFNDFINEVPLLKIYAKKGTLMYSGIYSYAIKLPAPSKDILHICHREGKLICLDYETTSKEIINSIVAYLDTYFEKESMGNSSTLEYYDIYQGLMFVTIQRLLNVHYIGIRVL